MSTAIRNIVVIGNPNSGKTSLFNILTGLNHKVGNYPGVTVEKKSGTFSHGSYDFNIIDVPGTYSLYPKSIDESIAYKTITSQKDQLHLQLIVVDAAHLRRNLLLATQVIDLGQPSLLVLTMTDTAKNMGRSVNPTQLSQLLGIEVLSVNSRTGEGIEDLKNILSQESYQKFYPKHAFIHHELPAYRQLIDTLSKNNKGNDYLSLHKHLNEHYEDFSNSLITQSELTQMQSEEINFRYQKISEILQQLGLEHSKDNEIKHRATYNWDKILLHPVLGYLVMLAVLFVVFQSVFWLAGFPMDFIDTQFSAFGGWVEGVLPADTWWSDLIVNGIIAGLGGVVIFVPQIAILFLFITLLEDSGYISRISFLMDRLFQKVGLSGKSVVPFLSGMACAIPAVMAARTIENPKHRLITVLVTPFMSCTARLPVYAILISLVIPDTYFFGFIGLQGLVFMGMYLLGFITALIASYILSRILYKNQSSYYIQELPVYQIPRWKNALNTMFEKSKVFLFEAGKIILSISIILWLMLSYGPSSKREIIEKKYEDIVATQGELTKEQADEQNAELLESSYAGIVGKFIEPAIQPLGYDWKIGISLIASFAAREVFVGTMATIYSIGELEDDDNTPLKLKLSNETRPDGTKVYDMATGVSLLLFYAFAMQCMATLAIVRRELNSWKWALIQLVGMTGLAYITAFLAYNLLK